MIFRRNSMQIIIFSSQNLQLVKTHRENFSLEPIVNISLEVCEHAKNKITTLIKDINYGAA